MLSRRGSLDAISSDAGLQSMSSDPTGEPRFLGCEGLVPEAVPHGAVAVIGVPAATPYPSGRAHSESAPAAIRRASAGQIAKLTHYDFDLGGPVLPDGRRLVDCGDLAFDPADLPGNRTRIAAAYEALLARGARCRGPGAAAAA